MREIKFRAKRFDNGELVTGYYCIQHEGEEMTRHHLIYNDTADRKRCFWYEIDVTTLQQYTGLTDANGTPIWEGDTLFINNIVVFGYVTWNTVYGCWAIQLEGMNTVGESPAATVIAMFNLTVKSNENEN